MKLYYNIKEVRDKLQMSDSRIRYYCDFFKLRVGRSRNGKIKFTQKDIDKLQIIKELSSVYKLHYLKKVLKLYKIENGNVKMKS